MIDAATIGITLALQDGVSTGIASITRDLQALDRAVDASAANLARLGATGEALRAGTLAKLTDTASRAASLAAPQAAAPALPAAAHEEPAPAAPPIAPTGPTPVEAPSAARAPAAPPAATIATPRPAPTTAAPLPVFSQFAPGTPASPPIAAVPTPPTAEPASAPTAAAPDILSPSAPPPAISPAWPLEPPSAPRSPTAPFAPPSPPPSPLAVPETVPTASGPGDAPTHTQAEGRIVMDGYELGRWLNDRLNSAAARPPAGTTGFDPRLSPAWPGPGAAY